MHMLHLLLAAAVFGTSQAVGWQNGTCPDLETLPRFLPFGPLPVNIFYERKSENNFIFSEGGKCRAILGGFGPYFFTALYRQISKNNEVEDVTGVSLIDQDTFGQKKIFNFKLNFVEGGDHKPLEFPAIIVASDEKNYMVTYVCQQSTDPETLQSKKLVSAWVYTKKRGDTSVDEAIKKDLAPLGLDYDKLHGN